MTLVKFMAIWELRTLLDSKDRKGHRVRSSVETFLRFKVGLGRNQVRR